jgi:hypothetical protein
VVANTHRSNFVQEKEAGYYCNGLMTHKINEGCHYLDKNGGKVMMDIYLVSSEHQDLSKINLKIENLMKTHRFTVDQDCSPAILRSLNPKNL